MVCAAAVLVVVLIRCLVNISADLHWDWNPRSEPGSLPVTSLGPAGLAWLNSASVLVAGISLAVHAMSGGRIHMVSSILVFAGAAFAARHMQSHAENMRLCGSWIAASMIALAAFHLAQHERPRRLIVTSLIGLLIPLGVHAAGYVWIDHADTVRDFQLHEVERLDAKGITFGSAQHRLLVERLNTPDAIGPFSLSNVFGSVLAALTVMALAESLRLMRERWWTLAVLATVPTVLGFLGVTLTRSKGALVALVSVSAFVFGVWWLSRRGTRRWPLGVLGLALVVLAVLTVFGRGAVGRPDTAEGERSILFRYQYWRAAARIMGEQDITSGWLGIGPAGFREAYPRVKVRFNPEQVTNTHNVFVDYTTMLGVGGLAWSGLLLGWMFRSGREAAAALAARPPGRETRGPPLAEPRVQITHPGWALMIVAPVFAVVIHIKLPLLGAPDSFMAFRIIAGLAGFLYLTAALFAEQRLMSRRLSVGLFASGLVLMVHSQIEMTFFSEGASALAWLVLGTGAAGRCYQSDRHPWSRFVVPITAIIGGVAMIVLVAIPVTRQQRWLADAASQWRSGNVASAFQSLESAIVVLPNAPRPYRTLATLVIAQGHGDQALEILDRAGAAGHDDVWQLRMRLDVVRRDMAVEPHGTAPDWAHEVARELVARRPLGLEDLLRVADFKWRSGRREEAAALYERSLELSEELYLDPMRQLTAEQAGFIKRRLGQTSQ